ncbi:fumarate reductase subunit C [Aliidiomarina haloalkalitolerans]|uniref:Fumarate reductase subunit C n=1 Tax=Aliidiomarina haloalkalitolerans TaxID=859059 RepID=A0A432VUS7_9GAMM|nr:fumarate reductase subunit C [Aliidiomarina haloalkalitolerans]RUO20201.1 fumarate reductase subunit C [Aliidiomarina haloalkalitolerans]
MAYKPNLQRTWWLQHRFFRAYMLREATVLPLVFLLCSLLAGVYSLTSADAFIAWQGFMAKPWVIVIHTLALLASFYHALTFFQLFPRVMPIRLGDKSVPAVVMIAAQWSGTLTVIALFLWLFGGGL